MSVVRVIVVLLRAILFSRASLTAENLALRHQLGVLRRSVKRSRLRLCDRIMCVWLSRLWADWRSSLVIVKPATVILGAVRAHRAGQAFAGLFCRTCRDWFTDSPTLFAASRARLPGWGFP